MSDILYSKRIKADDLAGLIAACEFPSETLMLLERLPAHVLETPKEREQLLLFEHFDPKKADVREYTSGRIFYEESELRWEKQGDLFSVVYLGSEAKRAALERYGLHDRTEVVKQLEEKPKLNYYALFGELLAPDDLRQIKPGAQPGEYFAEARIPRLLHYPIGQGQQPYVRLKVQEYVDKTGQVVFYRFQGLKPYKEAS